MLARRLSLLLPRRTFFQTRCYTNGPPSENMSEVEREFWEKPLDRRTNKPSKASDFYIPKQIANRGKDPLANAQTLTPGDATLNGAVYIAAPVEHHPSSAPSSSQSPTVVASLKLAAEPAPLPPTDLSLPAEVRWLYRIFLRHARLLPDGSSRRAEARGEIARQFRQHQEEKDPEKVRAQLDEAYSKLSFTRMSTPKLLHPRLGYIPPYAKARELFGDGSGEVRAGVQTYQYSPYGEMTSARGTRDGRSVVNSQGVTEEQVKRHYALVDRMNFRGPRWAGKPKY